ncbi:ATP-dependent helicase [Anaeromicropila populeti]|uniref:DNA 3'-5' helicase n=1 Tax=Anaeromicropila populeti TaxID=37658 RepID=A0A1I6HL45_9FIRM|nr:ATP-dependent helicase [Anaeromicropila populeti]SFR55156.1 DNA helicase-2 / ATP-dependent DNA helicase PcrA [Anaeromicropila populeti]
MNLSKAQETVVTHELGPMLVLAGPGSGKTFVITRRTRYLIEQCGVDPRNILVITFTKAAADEMKERFEQLMGENNYGVNFGTFHAIFFKILKYAYNFNGNNILREEVKYQMMQEIIRKLDYAVEDEKDFIESIISEISLVKGEGIQIDFYYSMNCPENLFQKIYKEYEEKLRQANLVDFDDMMLLCYQLLKEREDILKLWQKKYQYIMVDEAQDSNQMQYAITKMLAGETKHLMLVGDDDQSLYRFRGAKPEILLNFKKDFPNAKKVLLDYNYRSQENIVKGALKVIKNNKKRFEKDIKPTRKGEGEIVISGFQTILEENKSVVTKIQEIYQKGTPYRDIAVLFRTNTQPRALVGLLMAYNIPFRMKDTMPNIYDHWIAKNILAYIRLAMGQRERNLFLEVMNRPKRYIARDSVKEKNVDFNTLRSYYLDKSFMVDRINKLEYDLNLMKSMNPLAAIKYIRNGVGYNSYLEEYAKFRNIKVEELLEVLEELEENSKDFKTYSQWFSFMEQYQENLKEQIQHKNEKDYDSISLMTFHGCKGLEFKNVFIVDANEGITPHRKAVSSTEMEEERRMFYVAMTRAKDNLFLYYIKERYEKKLICSRFIGELLSDSSEIKEQARVEHKTYGMGTVLSLNEKKCTIKFDQLGVPKVLSLEFCIQNQLIKVISEQERNRG